MPEPHLEFSNEPLTGFWWAEDRGVTYVIASKDVSRAEFAAWLDAQDEETQAAMRPQFNSLAPN